MMNEESQFFNEFNEYMHRVLAVQEKLRKESNYSHFVALSNTALSVLMCIPREGSQNFKEITQKLNLPKSTLTGVVRQLESSGYIIQKVNNQDKRMKDLFLTEMGKRTQDEHDAAEKQVYAIVMGNLDLSEKEMLLSILKKGFHYEEQ